MTAAVIPHNRPTLGEDEANVLAGIIRSGHVVQGPRVEEFERAMAAFFGLQGGVAVNSGTSALEVALLALGVGPGDEVIMPSYVCAALYLATVRTGAEPRVVDIEPGTYAISPLMVEKAMSPRAKAIVVPHPFGLPADVPALQHFRVPIIEDCAQTLGATLRGQPVGTMGTVAICSFYATKLLCTGEGGMVLSNDRAVLDRARALREYDEAAKLDPATFNRKMTDLQAGLGLTQLSRLRSFLERRQALAAVYAQALDGAGVTLPAVPEGRTHIYYRYVIRVDLAAPSRQGAKRLDTLLRRMERRGVQCRRPVFCPLHQYLGLDGFPESDRAYKTAVSVPLYPTLTDEEAARVARTLCEELE